MTPKQQQVLTAWYVAKQAAAAAAARLAASPLAKAASEAAQKASALSAEVREAFFPVIEEGTHYVDLIDGWKIKSVCRYTREVDMSLFSSLRLPLAQQSTSLDDLIDWKASLKIKKYRELTAEAKNIFDMCVTTKEGTPTIELVPPKEE